MPVPTALPHASHCKADARHEGAHTNTWHYNHIFPPLLTIILPVVTTAATATTATAATIAANAAAPAVPAFAFEPPHWSVWEGSGRPGMQGETQMWRQSMFTVVRGLPHIRPFFFLNGRKYSGGGGIAGHFEPPRYESR